LVPSEHSSGATIRRSGLTKTGNAEARRVMVEAAWTYRLPARVGRILLDRLEGLPVEIRDIAWKAQVRLCARYRRLAAKGKPLPLVVAAIARELVGFAWATVAKVPPAQRVECQRRASPVRSPPRRPPDGPIHRNRQNKEPHQTSMYH
jgi:transposase